MNFPTLIVLGLQFGLQLLIIRYLFQLEEQGCFCALTNQRTYILSFLVLNFIVSLLHVFTNVFEKAGDNMLGSLFMSLYSIAGVANIFFIIQYVNQLKARQCECSESVYRDMMYVFALMDAIVLGMAMLLVLYVVLTSTDMKGLKKGLKKGVKKRVKKK